MDNKSSIRTSWGTKAIIFVVLLALLTGCLIMQGCSSSRKSSSAPSNSPTSVASSSASNGSAESQDKNVESSSDNGVAVPDLVGKNLDDVKNELKNFDVDYIKEDGSKANVFIKSNWRVDEQSLEPGSNVPKGSKLVLKLGHITEEKAEAKKAEEEAKKAEERANLEYIDVSVDQLVDDLNANAMNAKEAYKNGYYRITGTISNIDASGKYIDLDPVGSSFSWTIVQCYINDDATKNAVRQMSTGDTVTLCGQITEVGEITGYSVDIYFFQ